MAFNWQGLVDELLVVLLLGVLRQQDAHAGLIEARSAGPTHHLQHVVDWVVHVPVLPPVKLLGVHDDDEVRQHGHAPAKLLRDHEDLDGARLEEAFDDLALAGAEALVQEAHAVLQRLLQGPFPRSRQVRLHRLVGHMQESLGLVVCGCVQQQVDGRHACLLAIGHEDNHWLVGRVVLDGLIDGPAHGKQARRAVVDVEALDHHFQRHGTDVGREVEECVAGADPLTNILGVCQRGCQGNDSDGLLHLR
mmetsp:Transcript_58331/g.131372  ORF Transcript_58331/g.131372 Transcript_58331/m.131372 type:complete len:249 (+) Transcript_58331:1359-2105(+)